MTNVPVNGPAPSTDIARRGPGARRIRLCVLDVDGTLLDRRHRVPARNVAAIEQAQRAGMQILLATSRGPSALTSVLAQVPSLAHEVFVGSQGAVTARFTQAGDLATVSQQRMPVGAAHPLVRIALRHGIAVSWYSGAHWFVSDVDHTIAREGQIVGAQAEVRDLLSLDEGPDKLMLVAPDGRPASLLPVVEAIPPELLGQVSNPTYLEITRHDVDKAHAVELFCAASGVDPGEVLCMGDGPNDLGMFAFAGLSVAPANARPEVLAAADFTTGSNDDAGVAHMLDAILAANAAR